MNTNHSLLAKIRRSVNLYTLSSSRRQQNRKKKHPPRLIEHSMSSGGLFSNSRDHGLSSDDDEAISGGLLLDDGYARHSGSLRASGSSSQNRYRGHGSRGHSSRTVNRSSSSSSGSRHTYSTQNSVSLADFDKEYVDIDDDDDDQTRKGGRGDPRRKGGGRSKPGVDWMGEMTKLLLMSSKWKLALVGLLLGLLCAAIHQSYVWIKSERSWSGNGLSYLCIFVWLQIEDLFTDFFCLCMCLWLFL